MSQTIPSVLIIAGSDPSGGAGIQADIKTITALGGYAAAAITSLTAQNTKGVTGIHAVPGAFVAEQVEAVLSDIPVGAIKTGMLGTRQVIEAVAGALDGVKCPLVIDPVIVSTTGHRLIDDGALSVFKEKLVPMASLLTPNIPEAEALTGHTIEGVEGMEMAARAILEMGPKAVLVTGGHGPQETIADVLVQGKKTKVFESKRINTRHTHGTGCTLASAIALGLASGLTLEKAVEIAREYVLRAIRNAPGFGSGNGPLGHTLGHSILTRK